MGNAPSTATATAIGLAVPIGVIFVGATYAVAVANVPLYTVCFILLWVGMITSLALTISIPLVMDTPTKKALIISQTVIYSLSIVMLAYVANYSIGIDLRSRERYTMFLLPVSLLISVVAVSATVMTKLAAWTAASTSSPSATGAGGACGS